MSTQPDYSEEIHNRILLSVAAYSYEFEDHSIISDAEFDELSKRINPQHKTGNTMLDIFFAEEFSPDTGLWVRKHPEILKLKHIYDTVYKGEQQ